MNSKRRAGLSAFLTLVFFLSLPAACEQSPPPATGEQQEVITLPGQTLTERSVAAGTEPEAGSSPPAGFVFVPRGTVSGSDTLAVSFTYPEGATFAGETGTQYGAFVAGRTVTIPAFYMAATELSFGRWQEARDWGKTHGYTFANEGKGGGAEHPVTNVSWRDAVVWCNAASEKDGLEPVYYRYGGANILKDASGGSPPNAGADRALMLWEKNGYRLPTLDEREWAARGADPTAPDWLFRYSGSNNIDEAAWYYGTSGGGVGSTHPDFGSHVAGTKAPNRLGIYDLSGNVMEWGWDWMHFAGNGVLPEGSEGFTGRKLDPATPLGGPGYRSGVATQKPMMGGSWWSSSPYSLNVMWWGYDPSYQDGYVGFRVVRSWANDIGI
jgi:formylglycine-generating enzyme required for sulfatase activity